MRFAPLVLLLGPSVALAHVVGFDFVAPSGIGARTDGGFSALQWIDGQDPNGLATLTFFASRTGLPPFAAPPQDVALGGGAIPVTDPANVLAWDARAVAPGCYQPFAVLQDQIEGSTARPSSGLITVGPDDGGNLPPAIWILNPPTDAPGDGGGFALRMIVDDPDDATEVAVRWDDGSGDGGTIVAGLPISRGGGTLTYSINSGALPPTGVYYLRAEVTAPGQRCAVWWAGHLPGRAAPPVIDAGFPDAGADAPPPKGCGCNAGGAPLLLGAALLLRAVRTRSSCRPS